MKQTLVATLLAALCAPAFADPHWDRVPKKSITLFYPGTASMEWTQIGAQHGGARAMRKNEGCAGCHHDETADMGGKMVSGQKLEPNAGLVKGKAPAIPVLVQAAHDDGVLYLRLQWKQPPASGGAKMDEKNAVKVAVMLEEDGKVENGAFGCWASCHHDLRSMPDVSAAAPKHPRAKELDIRSDGPTKYLKESRTAVEGKASPLGGWDKLRPEADFAALLAEGRFLEMWQWRSAEPPRAGYVLEARRLKEAKGLAEAKNEGGTWTATFKRRFAGGPGVHAIAPGKTYNIGFAIHDDYSNWRYHHVSLGYRLALDNPKADINAVRQ